MLLLPTQTHARRWMIGAAAVLLVSVSGLLIRGLVLHHDHGRARPASPRVALRDVSVFAKACLVSSGDTKTDIALSTATWRGMQDATGTGHVNVEHLTTIGAQGTNATALLTRLAPKSESLAAVYVDTAIAQHCGLVVTTGTIAAQSAMTSAKRHPGTRFLIVGSSATPSGNVATVSTGAPASVRSNVEGAVQAGTR